MSSSLDKEVSMQGVVKTLSLKDLQEIFDEYSESASFRCYVKYKTWPKTDAELKGYLVSRGLETEESIADLDVEELEDYRNGLDVEDNIDTFLHISTNSPFLYLAYMLTQKFGVFECIEVSGDEAESIKSAETLTQLIEQLKSYGVSFVGGSTKTPGRNRVQVESGIELTPGVDIKDLVREIEVRLLAYSKQYINKDVTEETLGENSAAWIYLEGEHDYNVYRSVDNILRTKYKTSILYSNAKEFHKHQNEIELERSQTIFRRILEVYKPEEKYTVSLETPYVSLLTLNEPVYDEDGNMSLRKLNRGTYTDKHWYVAARNLYDWLIDQDYKVYTFDPILTRCGMTDAFYAAFALLQLSKPVKILISGDKLYKQILADMITLDCSDLTTRILQSYNVYADNSLRILADFNGHFVLGWIKKCMRNVTFNLIEITTLEKYIRKLPDPPDPKTCKDQFEIALDADVIQDPVAGMLTYQKIKELTDMGFKLRPENPLELIAGRFYEGNLPEFVDPQFEDYTFRVCRVFDQLLRKFSGFTTVRDLVAYSLLSPDGKGRRFYVGVGTYNPVCKVDVIIPDENNLLIEDTEYSGPVYDFSVIDDIELCEFVKEAGDEEKCDFWEKMKYMYERIGKECPFSKESVEAKRMKPMSPTAAFMTLYNNATRQGRFRKDDSMYDLRNPPIQMYKSGSGNVFDDMLTPFYIGMASQWNYQGWKHFLPVLMEKTTVYGYRTLANRESPINLFGGPNPTGGKSNLFLYGECFQRLRPEPRF